MATRVAHKFIRARTRAIVQKSNTRCSDATLVAIERRSRPVSGAR
jgi:hypothetical protein